MFKCHFNRTAFVKARVAQSVQREAANLKVVGSSTTLGNFFFSFCILSLSSRFWQVDLSHRK